MAYATVDDVRSLLDTLGVVISGVSKVTETEVTEFITQEEATINSVLKGLGYSVPIPSSATNDTAMLKKFTAEAVAVKVFSIVFVGTQTEFPAKVRYWQTEFEAFMNRLRLGQVALIDVEPAATGVGVLRVGYMKLGSGRGTEYTS